MGGWKYIEENIFKVLMRVAAGCILLCLLLIIGTVFMRGIAALDLDMITKTPQGGFYLGKEGGILNAIVGSLLIGVSATAVSLILSIPVAVYLNMYARSSSRIVNGIRLALDILWGVPSIVYGVFGFIIMSAMGMRTSLLAGIIAVSLLIFPIMSRAIDEVFQTVPRDILDASYALGAMKYETAIKVILRQSALGIINAVLLAFGRGIGDAASVLFTAGYSDAIPGSLSEPAATLPLAIFFQLGTPFPEVQQRAYASALILTVVILVISIATRVIAVKLKKHVIK